MPSPIPPAALDELARFLGLGPSMILATRDERMIPALVRCAGAQLVDGRVRAVVPLPEGERALANVASNGSVALSAAIPTTYRTFQVKGRDARVVDWPDGAAASVEHLEAFTREVVAGGYHEALARHFWSHERFVTIVFTPDELYDQTPGPKAGLAVGA